jgi:hypothetical protein
MLADNSEMLDPGLATRRRTAADPVGFCTITLIFWTIYALTGCYRLTPYNAHVYLAYSILHGRFDLVRPPGHFEVINVAGHNYVAYGIAPSLLMLPFVALWGLDFHQALFGALLAALAVSFWWSSLGWLNFKGSERGWLTALFGLGSLFWFYGGRDGSTWSLTHITVVFGLMLAIQELVGRRRGWIIGLGFGLAVLSRQPALLSMPFFIGVLALQTTQKGQFILTNLSFASTFGGLALFDAYYNYARFGNPFDNGYRRWALKSLDVGPHCRGLFNIRYVPRNAQMYFLQLPYRVPGFPWFDPALGGFSIFLSTPALFLALATNYRDRLNLLALYCCIGIQGTSGFAEFGCRYSLDYLPFVMLLAAAGTRNLPSWMLRVVTVAGVMVEIWGIASVIYKGL